MSFCRGVVTGQAMSRASLAVRDDALCGLIGNSATAVESLLLADCVAKVVLH